MSTGQGSQATGAGVSGIKSLAQRDGATLPLIDDGFGSGYLARFCHEKTVTINTTAAGGNIALRLRVNRFFQPGIECRRAHRRGAL